MIGKLSSKLGKGLIVQAIKLKDESNFERDEKDLERFKNQIQDSIKKRAQTPKVTRSRGDDHTCCKQGLKAMESYVRKNFEKKDYTKFESIKSIKERRKSQQAITRITES